MHSLLVQLQTSFSFTTPPSPGCRKSFHQSVDSTPDSINIRRFGVTITSATALLTIAPCYGSHNFAGCGVCLRSGDREKKVPLNFVPRLGTGRVLGSFAPAPAYMHSTGSRSRYERTKILVSQREVLRRFGGCGDTPDLNKANLHIYSYGAPVASKDFGVCPLEVSSRPFLLPFIAVRHDRLGHKHARANVGYDAYERSNRRREATAKATETNSHIVR